MSFHDEKKSSDETETEAEATSSRLPDIDPVAERRLLQKLDLVLLPLFMLLYTTNFVDRTAIGTCFFISRNLHIHDSGTTRKCEDFW